MHEPSGSRLAAGVFHMARKTGVEKVGINWSALSHMSECGPVPVLEAAKVCKVNHYLSAKTVATWLFRDSFCARGSNGEPYSIRNCL